MPHLTAQLAVNIWLGIASFWLALSAYEIAAILTHRFHTISWYGAQSPAFAWFIGLAAALTGIGFFVWFVFFHTRGDVGW